MEFFKSDSNIDFLSMRRWTAALSVILFVGSLAALVMNGLDLGLSFTGGTQIEVGYEKPAPLKSIRSALSDMGYGKAVVKMYGSSNDILITLPPMKADPDATPEQVKTLRDARNKKLLSALPGATLRRVDYIGAQVGKELLTKGVLALLVSLIGTMIYIALRFEFRFAVSSAVALIHDPILILGLFALFRWEFNLPSLAALLAVIGYSLNDTIVVFDRVRENFRKIRKGSPVDVMNLSINQTLSRTIITSALTLVVVVALLLFGGEMIRGFSLALIIGIVIGTYSSIYVAGALAIAMGLSRKDLLPVSKEILDETP